ncbi:hypothetical protein ACOSQ3_024091 [Xanthoceras sorbifolium]
MNHLLKSLLFLSLLVLLLIPSDATDFEIRNDCSYTVWAAASPGGGRRLDPGQTWTLKVAAGTSQARIWGRTSCNFDASGRGGCQTGDCGGALNKFGNMDFYDISLVDGFNIPMEFSPTSEGCQKIKCTADVNGQCPEQLRATDGCNNPCTVFKTNEYCCTNGRGSCGPTDFSKFFKGLCPDAFSYPQDDNSSQFACPSGSTNYKVVFCSRG